MTEQPTASPAADDEVEVSHQELAAHAKLGCRRCGASGLVRGEVESATHGRVRFEDVCPCALKRWTRAEKRRISKLNAFADQLEREFRVQAESPPATTEEDHA